jgi:hypothetical protein
MSCSATKEAVRNRTKTVTRRLAWDDLWNDEEIILVEQAQGLKKGDHQVPLARVAIASTRSEPLNRLEKEPEYGRAEMILEGFPDMDPSDFITMFVRMNKLAGKTYSPRSQVVNRIEWVYLPWSPS